MSADLAYTGLADPMFWSQKVREGNWPSDPQGDVLTIVDLFSGCGGLTMGALLAARFLNRSISVELAVDHWSAAMEVYKKNFGHLTRNAICGDVKSVMRSFEGQGIDVVMAGPPCQGHSDLNNSTRRVDTRNELYTLPASFAISHDVGIVLIENVPAVVHSEQNVVTRAERRLRKSGYATAQLVVDTSNLGIPQKRKRHLLIASNLHATTELEAISGRILSYRSSPRVIDFIGDLADSFGCAELSARTSSLNRSRIDYLFDNAIYDLPNELRPPCHRDKAHSYSSMYGRIYPDRPAQTITSGFGSMGQGRFVHPTKRRMIAPREAARIQGFPDYFEFKDAGTLTGLREMIANAVPPVVAAVVLTELLQPVTRKAGLAPAD